MDNKALSLSKAAQSTIGCSAWRKPQQIVRSNIHCGISKLWPALASASRQQR